MRADQALVLLIDDVRPIVEELLTFMELHGIPAVGVSDLDAAIAALEQNPAIRILACDVRLGRESGLSIVQRIQGHAQLRARPFRYLFITGDQMRQDALPDMPDHTVLTKPVQPQVLIDVLSEWLGERAQDPHKGEV
ncbi:response regulator [Novosphingobium soli]|uniref:Response regulator n=1 Tax=Novosphingobium soli TaxID=574956 RepID=A0ABV6CVB8_9SPHN